MDSQLTIEVANWLAYVIDPTINVSKLGFSKTEKARLKLFLETLYRHDLTASKPLSTESLSCPLKNLLADFNDLTEQTIPVDFYFKLRFYLKNKQWVALIIPSGQDPVIDEVLSDSALLSYLVKDQSCHRGIVLQLDTAPDEIFSLLDIYPAIKTALNDVANWPGVLLWSLDGDAIFLPVSSTDLLEIDVEARIQWIFSHLANYNRLDLGRLKIEYCHHFPEVFVDEDKTINLLQLSDLHIGRQVSTRRMARVKQFIRQLVEELSESSIIIPVITGDLMTDPSEAHINLVGQFWCFLLELGTQEPIFILGNHDVRKDGQINDNYRSAVGFPVTKVLWFEQAKLALVCVNSVMHGKLEHGFIDAEQIAEIEYELDRKPNREDYKIIILLHHHPVAHNRQNPAAEPFYKTVIGVTPGETKPLEDAYLLLAFAKKYKISAILHGHQHRPLITQLGGMPIMSCGSTSGSRSDTDGGIYFSANILTINQQTGKQVGRLIAYRKSEAGFIESKSHEIVFRTN